MLGGDEAAAHARAVGFASVQLDRVTLPAVLPGGGRALYSTLAAHGIAADIAALDDRTRDALVAEVLRLTEPFTEGDALHSSLTASVLILS